MFTSVMMMFSLGLRAAAAMPTAPYPQPMSRALPVWGRFMASMRSRVPESTFRFEKTLDEVKNSKGLPLRLVRTSPNLSSHLGADAK